MVMPRQNHKFDAVVIDIEGNTAATLSISGSAADVDDLAEGVYDIHSDVDCYVKVHATDASDVATSDGYLLLAGNVVSVLIRPDSHLGAITGGGSGTLRYQKVG